MECLGSLPQGFPLLSSRVPQVVGYLPLVCVHGCSPKTGLFCAPPPRGLQPANCAWGGHSETHGGDRARGELEARARRKRRKLAKGRDEQTK